MLKENEGNVFTDDCELRHKIEVWSKATYSINALPFKAVLRPRGFIFRNMVAQKASHEISKFRLPAYIRD